MDQNAKRQAGTHSLDGLYPYEVLRRIFGDEVAEEFLLVEYKFLESEPSASDVKRYGVNVLDLGFIHAESELASGGCP